MCCRGVVEYDAEGFTKLTLLLMWKDFCFLVHGRRPSECTHLEPAAVLRSLSTCSPAPPSGPAAVLPAGPAHPHLPVGLPLHQQRSALLAGAEVVPVQPPLGRQRDGQAGKVSVVSASRPPDVSIWNKRRSISRPAVLIFTIFMPPSINRNRYGGDAAARSQASATARALFALTLSFFFA